MTEGGETGTRRSAHMRLLLLVLLWTAPGLLAALQAYVIALNEPNYSLHLGDALLWHLPTWYYWVPATYVVLAVTERAPFDRGRRLRSVGIHLVALLLLSLPHVVIMAAVPKYLVHVDWYANSSLLHAVEMLYPYALNQDALTYGAVAGVAFALQYQRRLRERTVDMARLESRVAQAELAALRARLQPHFLFNTLNAIGTLVRRADTKAATNTLSTLSRLLRKALDSSGHVSTTLHDEVEFVKDYLSIESTRLGDRLEVSYEIQPAALTAHLPSLFLQPLVENAIIHGIAPLPDGGTVTVRAGIESGRLWIEVEDNGNGLPEEWSLEDDAGHGLSIMEERLHHAYGDQHELTIEPRSGGGTMVRVAIPHERREPQETE